MLLGLNARCVGPTKDFMRSGNTLQGQVMVAPQLQIICNLQNCQLFFLKQNPENEEESSSEISKLWIEMIVYPLEV